MSQCCHLTVASLYAFNLIHFEKSFRTTDFCQLVWYIQKTHIFTDIAVELTERTWTFIFRIEGRGGFEPISTVLRLQLSYIGSTICDKLHFVSFVYIWRYIRSRSFCTLVLLLQGDMTEIL